MAAKLEQAAVRVGIREFRNASRMPRRAAALMRISRGHTFAVPCQDGHLGTNSVLLRYCFFMGMRNTWPRRRPIRTD
jgi:hypothetical protein